MNNHRNKKKYKFTDKKQSIRGIVSIFVGVLAVILLVIGIIISYENRGNGGLIIGLFGIIALFLSILGFYEGIKSFREEEIFYHCSWIGTITNAIILVSMAMVILIGV